MQRIAPHDARRFRFFIFYVVVLYMPRRYPRRNAKRKYRRARRKYGMTQQPRRSIMPQTFSTKLVYVENIKLTNTVAGIVDNGAVYRANGMFDPNFAIGGHQPRGFDELCGGGGGTGLYNHYTVIGSKMTCSFSNTNGADYGLAFVRVQSLSGTSTLKNDFQEGRDTKTVILPPKSATSYPPKRSITFSVKKDMGIKNPLSNTAIRGSSIADPAQLQYFVVAVAGQDDAIALGDCLVEVRIEYIAVFTDPVTPQQS